MKKTWGWTQAGLLALAALWALAACGPLTPTPAAVEPTAAPAEAVAAASDTPASAAPTAVAAASDTPPAAAPPSPAAAADPADWRAKGPADAAVTIVEYSDFQ